MKKTIVLAALIVTSFTLSAQTLIPKVGFGITNMAVSEGEKNQSRLGLILGGAVDYEFKDNLSFQGELLFIQKGSKFSESEDDFSFDSKTRLNYLEIPLLVKAKFGEDDLKFYGNAGISLSFALGGSTETTMTGEDFDGDKVTETENEKIKFGNGEDQMKGMDFGLQIGGGVVISEKIVVDLRYGIGLSNLYNDSGDYTEKNRAFQITVGMPLSIF